MGGGVVTPFQKNLAFGQAAEAELATWLRKRGNCVLPVYDIEYETGKGPRLFGSLSPVAEDLICPDLLVFSYRKQVFWAECKLKSVFTWHRNTRKWTTGIDKRHWEHYVKVCEETAIPLWILFLHKESSPDPRDIEAGCPKQCPKGIFGNTMARLRESINHESAPKCGATGHGSSGMVYWAHDALLDLTLQKQPPQSEPLRRSSEQKQPGWDVGIWSPDGNESSSGIQPAS